MSHTPAPWTVSELDASGEVSEYHIFIEPGVAVIERKVEGKNQYDMADARLIASAPGLLFQLLAAANYIDALGGDSKSYRAAIKAAKGEA